MYDENFNEGQSSENTSTGGLHIENNNQVHSEDNTTSQSEAQQTSAQEEGQQYRYGRSYYQNQQDSVYHTHSYGDSSGSSNSSSNSNTAYQNEYGQNHYQTYTTGSYTSGNGQNVQQNAEPVRGKGRKNGIKILKVAACLVAVAAIGAGSAFGTVKLMERNTDEKSSVVQTNSGSSNKNNGASNYQVSTVSASTAVVTDVSDVVEKTMPAVVKITNVGTQSYQGFFGQGGTYEYESNGSGIIIGQTEEELLVVTNQHVVAGADKLKVIFIDEESCEANVKGTDAEKDLAVIAVPTESLKEETLNQIKVATLGDSTSLNVGEPAIAIGNALGYGQSVTLGVISAKDREVTTENGTNTLIQTDAAINPGNSGGALLNIAGEVVGINSVKYSSTEVEGMGYAIPISDATPIINDLMNKETKTKVDDDKQSYLGISGVDITNDVAQTYNMPKGVYVAQVVEDSPAEEAGIKKGDIITKLAGVSVTSFDELKAELEYHAAGTVVEVQVLTQAQGTYGYESKIIDVTLAKRED